MQIASLVLGITAFTGMIIGLVPSFGWYNWFNIPISLAGIIVCIIALSAQDTDNKTNSIIGVILCGIALLVGPIRLFLGAGII